MRLHRIVLATVALTLALAPLSARAAQAGPDYVASSPSDGEKRPTAPDEVWIAFTMPLDQSSKLVVVDECDRRVDDRDVLIIGNRISVGLKKKPSGKYEAHWQVRAPSGATGDGIGVLRFEVTGGDACGADPHAGHGGSDKDGKTNQHDGHGTDDEDTSSSGHQSSGGTHSSTGTPSSSSGHSMSGGSSPLASGDHGGGNGKNKKNGPAGNDEPGDSRDIAAPGVPDLPSVAGSDVLIALLLSMVLGAAGGYVVRVSRVL